MNALEVRVLEVKPAVVKFNFEEMSAYAKQLSEEYKGLVFDENAVKEGKKTVAELKKIQKSVNDFKIKTKKELTESVSLFEAQCKDIISEFDEPINFISDQLEKYESERIRVKQLKIDSFISQGYEEVGIEPKFQKVEQGSDWLNATKSEKDLLQDIKYQLQICANNQTVYYQNVELIHTLVDSANVKYSLGVPMNPVSFVESLDYKTIDQIKESIISAAERQQAQEVEFKAKAEREANAKAMETVSEVIENASKFIPVEANAEEPLKTISIMLQGTQAQFDAFKEYLKVSGMKYKML